MAKAPTKPATSAPPVAATPQAPGAPEAAATPARKLRFKERPDLAETFADGIERMTFDALTLRVEFCVNRRRRTQ